MTELPKIDWIKVPPLSELIRLLESLASACGTYPSARVVGIALNTGHLDDAEAKETVNQMEIELGLPVCDPVRTGAGKLLEAVMA